MVVHDPSKWIGDLYLTVFIGIIFYRFDLYTSIALWLLLLFWCESVAGFDHIGDRHVLWIASSQLHLHLIWLWVEVHNLAHLLVLRHDGTGVCVAARAGGNWLVEVARLSKHGTELGSLVVSNMLLWP